MKRIVFFLAVLFNLKVAYSQLSGSGAFTRDNFTDSIRNLIQHTGNDSIRVNLLNSLGTYFAFIRQDSSIFYLAKAIELGETINYLNGCHEGYAEMAFVLNSAGNYGKALDMALKSLKIAEKLKTDRLIRMSESYDFMALINLRNNFDTIARDESLQNIRLFEETGESKDLSNRVPYTVISNIYLKWKLLDSALFYAQKGYDIEQHYPVRSQVSLSVTASTLANVCLALGKVQLAREYFLHGIETDKKFNAPLLKVRLFNNFARFYKNIGQMDSCIYYAEMAFQLCRNHQFGEQATDAASLVAQTYEQLGKPDSALKYMKIFIAAKDTIFNQSKLLQIQLLNFDEGQRQNDIRRAIDEAQERYKNKVRYYSLIATAGIFLFLTLILYRNNRSKQIANRALVLQKKEVDQQRTKAEDTLHELRSTQSLLIQSEKMASLGELTAGIAHEIQNPLNFVNNFGEVNSELLEELKEIQKKDIRDFAKENDIISNIQQNEEKIIHHGKRADAIVKSMLQHSRSRTGQKEPTDINALADEYLRLSYYGFRTNDKNFNCIMQTEFDVDIGKINIIPQDISRVLLNFYNNAFYAISEKIKLKNEFYEPKITVITRKINSKVEIRIRDNGGGIPAIVKDKIFQPFFTTKPTGQGTGLGLSLAYDIIKAHEGEINVETREGDFTEFIIKL
jgi:two-component system, NtrC family, sensor kinase